MWRWTLKTGKVTILRYTAFQEVGKAAHPSYVEGQMQGGTVQGIGWALNEEFVYDEDGSVLNASFLDYRMPTALDVPMIETVIVETPNPGPSLRPARRGRGLHRSAHGRYRQRHLPRHRATDDPSAHETRGHT